MEEKKQQKRFMKMVLIISMTSWILAWLILVFKLDLLTYIAFIFYGLGISGLTIYITLKATRLN